MRFAALRRVRPYVRPHDRQMLAMLVAAMAGLAASTIVPLVIKAIIDGPIAHHRPGAVWGLAAAGVGLGAIEAGCAAIRRYVLSYAALGMETAMRNDLYAHLQ